MGQHTLEASAYATGVYEQLVEQHGRHNLLLVELMTAQAKVELSEKNLCTTRDHLAMMTAKPEVILKSEWKTALAMVRFVGWRLSDACAALLQQHRKLAFADLLGKLNDGNYRFRTGSPLREIHAAVLRHPNIKREGDLWMWTGPEKGQKQIRLRLLRQALAGDQKK